MEKKTINIIKKHLRRAAIAHPAKAEAVRRARRKFRIGAYKNGRDKFKTKFECAQCKCLMEREALEVDHIKEVGQFDGSWTEYINRLFCSVDNLQVLCRVCHAKKTKKFNEAIHGGKKYL